MKIRKIIKANKSTPKKTPVQAADFDATAFRERRQAARADREVKRDKRMTNILNQIRESDDQIQTAFELLVPPSGKADTTAGEIVRAMMRILYRDYNDGDLFYEGYGIETCADAAAFLADKIPGLEDKFGDIAQRCLEGKRYTEALNDIAEKAVEYILAHPDLVLEPNEDDMFDYDGKDWLDANDWIPEYEYDVSIPDNVMNQLEAGNINETDVEWELESWGCFDGVDPEIEVNGDTIYIHGLNREAYDEIEDNMYDWLENWGRDLIEEYGDPDEDEEDEYEDED